MDVYSTSRDISYIKKCEDLRIISFYNILETHLRLILALIPLGRINFHSNSQYLIQALSNIIKET